MAKNKNMHKAKKNKNDEFYTRLTDIEKEVHRYKEHFKGKVVYLNCDDPEWSNFFRFFASNFEYFELRKLIATHYREYSSTYKLVLEHALTPKTDGTFEEDIDLYKTPLEQNGDFRSPECIELLKESDIVVTNPPFSLFREYVAQLMEYEKKFLIIGNMNALTYKEIFPLIKENKIWLGMTYVKEFLTPDGETKKFGNVCWFTNLPNRKRNDKLTLFRKYSPEKYPKYDNYDAINVDKVAEIPEDYDGYMGVPITFLDKYNPEQFEIIGQMANTSVDENNKGYPFINGKRMYARIIIKKKGEIDNDNNETTN